MFPWSFESSLSNLSSSRAAASVDATFDASVLVAAGVVVLQSNATTLKDSTDNWSSSGSKLAADPPFPWTSTRRGSMDLRRLRSDTTPAPTSVIDATAPSPRGTVERDPRPGDSGRLSGTAAGGTVSRATPSPGTSPSTSPEIRGNERVRATRAAVNTGTSL